MDWLRRLLNRQRRHLESEEPVRAFSPDPTIDYWPLASKGNNERAYQIIRTEGVHLVSVETGEPSRLEAFDPGILLFATTWEPYSAQNLGRLKGLLESKRTEKIGIVFFEDSREDVLESKADAWYLSSAYVLGSASLGIRDAVGRVPFLIGVKGGKVEEITEGLHCVPA